MGDGIELREAVNEGGGKVIWDGNGRVFFSLVLIGIQLVLIRLLPFQRTRCILGHGMTQHDEQRRYTTVSLA